MSAPKSRKVGRVRNRGELIRTYIIANVHRHPADIAKVAAEKFSCTRQAVHKHIRKLVNEGALVSEGNTRNRQYHLAPLVGWSKQFRIEAKLSEDYVWSTEIAPLLSMLPDNVKAIWQYGFTEMFNNAIEHSSGANITVSATKTAASTNLVISDDGVGIFGKIKAAMNLLDERHSVLELAKGKFTTDPENHSGEGIFFTSRMFDKFTIGAGKVGLVHLFGDTEDWIVQPSEHIEGTAVAIELFNHTSRSIKKVFDGFTTGDDYGFTKTVVPVKLTQYGSDKLVSRSQARRLLVRIERFKHVIFDFTDVETIGQAFADEVFRVFARKHPEIQLTPIRQSPEVAKMISRARNMT